MQPGRVVQVTRSCAIAADELEWRFTGPGGPGGQHANTSNTKVELRFDVAASRSLGPRQRARLLARLGPTVRVTASERRSQLQNRELAVDRLRARLAAALRIERPRVATQPSAAATRRRVDEKRRRADLKRGRRRPPDEEYRVTGLAEVLLVVAGVVAVLVVLDAAVRTFVVPRGSVVLFTVVVFRVIRRVLALFAPARRGYEARDRVMALYAPLALLALPATSMLVVFGAFACIFEGLETRGWRDAFLTSGSSLLTLGFVRPHGLPSSFAAFGEATIGLTVLALLIAYLPTIYNSFSRREVAVTDLSIRAGTPPTPREMLVRAHATGFLGELDDFWQSWMTWFTEVQETHTSYGSLPFFRSPNPNRSWVTAAGAVLDGASVRLAAVDIPFTPAAPLCIRAGYVALRELAGFFGFDYDDAPAPDDPISVAREEFDELCDQLAAAGVPLKADRDQAWRDFAGWRVNYDRVLLTLAALVMAPYAPWVSDRSAVQPLAQYKWGRRRIEITRRAQR